MKVIRRSRRLLGRDPQPLLDWLENLPRQPMVAAFNLDLEAVFSCGNMSLPHESQAQSRRGQPI